MKPNRTFFDADRSLKFAYWGLLVVNGQQGCFNGASCVEKMETTLNLMVEDSTNITGHWRPLLC